MTTTTTTPHLTTRQQTVLDRRLRPFDQRAFGQLVLAAEYLPLEGEGYRWTPIYLGGHFVYPDLEAMYTATKYRIVFMCISGYIPETEYFDTLRDFDRAIRQYGDPGLFLDNIAELSPEERLGRYSSWSEEAIRQAILGHVTPGPWDPDRAKQLCQGMGPVQREVDRCMATGNHTEALRLQCVMADIWEHVNVIFPADF